MRKSVCAKMIFCLLHFLPLFVTFPGLHGLRVNPYGLYEDIVVEISNQVPRQKCQRALDNLEVSPFLIARLARSDPRNSFLCRPCIFLFVLAFSFSSLHFPFCPSIFIKTSKNVKACLT